MLGKKIAGKNYVEAQASVYTPGYATGMAFMFRLHRNTGYG